MFEISTVSMKRTGARQAAGTWSRIALSCPGFSRNRPSSAGSSFSSSSSIQPGCTKSPVPTTRMPFNWAHL